MLCWTWAVTWVTGNLEQKSPEISPLLCVWLARSCLSEIPKVKIQRLNYSFFRHNCNLLLLARNQPCHCRAFSLKMFITLLWSPVKSLLWLLFLASYLCSALQDTVEQTVIYSSNFTCKTHYIITKDFISPRVMSAPVLHVQSWWQWWQYMVTAFTKPDVQTFLCAPAGHWCLGHFLSLFFFVSLCLLFFFFCLIFCRQTITDKRWQKNLVTVYVHKVLWFLWNISHFIPILASKTRISRFACFLVFPGYISRLRAELEWFLRIIKLHSSTEQLRAARARQCGVKAASLAEDLYLVIMKF